MVVKVQLMFSLCSMLEVNFLSSSFQKAVVLWWFSSHAASLHRRVFWAVVPGYIRVLLGAWPCDDGLRPGFRVCECVEVGRCLDGCEIVFPRMRTRQLAPEAPNPEAQTGSLANPDELPDQSRQGPPDSRESSFLFLGLKALGSGFASPGGCTLAVVLLSGFVLSFGTWWFGFPVFTVCVCELKLLSWRVRCPKPCSLPKQLPKPLYPKAAIPFKPSTLSP